MPRAAAVRAPWNRVLRAATIGALGLLCQCSAAPQGPGAEATPGEPVGDAEAALSTLPLVLGQGGPAGAQLGGAVARAGDVNGDGFDDFLVGAPGEETVRLFQGSVTGLVGAAAWTRQQLGTGFGKALSGAGDVNGDGYDDVLLGAPLANGGAGQAEVYLGSPGGLSALPTWVGLGPLPSSMDTGIEVAGAGDVDGDGYDDILVSSTLGPGVANGGRAQLFLGGPSGPSSVASWTAFPPPAPYEGSLGSTLAALGDVNGDGYDDVAVGGYGDDYAYYYCDLECLTASGGCGGCCCGYTSFPASARVRVFLGGPSGLGGQPAADLAFSSASNILVVPDVAGLGDVNGDGYADMAVGITDPYDYGYVEVYFGAPGGVTASPVSTLPDPGILTAFGAAVAGPGDLDGDGYADLLVGAPGYGPAWWFEGQAYVFSGGPLGFGPSPSWTADPADTDLAHFGSALTGAGDVDGDSVPDVLVGAWGYGQQFSPDGRAYLFHGAPCSALVVGTPCDDGDACTLVDTCQLGVCGGGSRVSCPASGVCQEASVCDPATGLCVTPPKPDGTPCDDGNACTTVDTCQSAVCHGSSLVFCVAQDACHKVGTCDPATGQCSAPVQANGSPCDDGDACTQTDTCQQGLCVGSSPVVCPARETCHQPSVCDPSSGLCTTAAESDGTPCDDANACTGPDVCQSGACVAGPTQMCPAPDACHGEGVCDPLAGSCSAPALPDGTPCDGGICSHGACEPGSGGGGGTGGNGGAPGAGGASGDGGGAGGTSGVGGDGGHGGAGAPVPGATQATEQLHTEGGCAVGTAGSPPTTRVTLAWMAALLCRAARGRRRLSGGAQRRP